MKGNLLPLLHGLLFPVSSKGSFICTLAFGTLVLEHLLEWEISLVGIDMMTHPTMIRCFTMAILGKTPSSL